MTFFFTFFQPKMLKCILRISEPLILYWTQSHPAVRHEKIDWQSLGMISKIAIFKKKCEDKQGKAMCLKDGYFYWYIPQLKVLSKSSSVL